MKNFRGIPSFIFKSISGIPSVTFLKNLNVTWCFIFEEVLGILGASGVLVLKISRISRIPCVIFFKKLQKSHGHPMYHFEENLGISGALGVLFLKKF